MRLILFHPGAAQIDCRACRRFVHDMETGEKKTYRAGPARVKTAMPRPEGQLPPCDKCPKESPTKSPRHELSVKNWRAFWFYREMRATCGACLTDREKQDRLLRRNLAIIDGIYRQWEARHAASELAQSIPWPKLK